MKHRVKHVSLFVKTLVLFLSFQISKAYEGIHVNSSITVRGIERSFITYIPSTYNPSKPTPLLFMFHGLTRDAHFVADNYQWQEIADRNNFIVIFPDSLPDLPCKNITLNLWFYEFHIWDCYDREGKRWDIAHVLNGYPLPGYIGKSKCESQDLDFIRQLYEHALLKFNIDKDRVFASGHSFGGFFAYYATVCLDFIRAFGQHSAGIWSVEIVTIFDWILHWPMYLPKERKLAGILIHSTDDDVVMYRNSEILYKILQKMGHKTKLITLKDKGHAWDGSLNQIQWNFFMNHVDEEKKVEKKNLLFEKVLRIQECPKLLGM